VKKGTAVTSPEDRSGDRLVIRTSRRLTLVFAVLLLVASSLLLAVGLNARPPLSYALWLAAGIGLVAGLQQAARLTGEAPTLVIDRRGIENRRVPYGLVEWGDFRAVWRTAGGKPLLCFRLKDPERDLPKLVVAGISSDKPRIPATGRDRPDLVIGVWPLNEGLQDVADHVERVSGLTLSERP